MVDRALILRKLSQLEEYHRQIQEYSNLSLQEYTHDWKTQRIVERTLQMMVELCLDITSHIISDRRLRVPTSYADSFKVLEESGLIDSELLKSLDRMAKFRSIIARHCDKVDEAIVVLILNKHLEDFLLFRDAVLHIVDLTDVQ